MAYVTAGYKWGNNAWGDSGGEVTWTMDGMPGLDMEAGYNPSDYRHAIQDAFDAWENVADINFTYVDAASADISLSMESLAGSTIGRATMSYWDFAGVPDVMASASIVFDSDETWAPDGTGGLSLFAVALHEIGHAIGFDHATSTAEIMWESITSLDNLGAQDIAGAEYVYGANTESPPTDDDDSWITNDAFDTTASGGDGGASGGAGIIAAVLGILMAVFGLGGGLFAAVGAMGSNDDEEDTEDEVDVAEVYEDAELMTIVHSLFLDGDGGGCDHGHGHGHSHGEEISEHGGDCMCGDCAHEHMPDDMILV